MQSNYWLIYTVIPCGVAHTLKTNTLNLSYYESENGLKNTKNQDL